MSPWVERITKTKNFAILCLTVYGIGALLAGVDHAIVFLVASLIAGIAGYEIKALRKS